MRFACLAPVLLCLFAVTSLRAQSGVPILLRPLPGQTMTTSTPPITIELTDYFGAPGIAGTRFVQYDTIFGLFGVELRTDFAPRHVTNFLNYVASGAYVNSFMHRAASFDGGAVSIVQGGGYTYTLPFQAVTISKQAPIALEYNLVNARGTLAAARTSDVNSATSEWYFNVRDNTTILGPANGGGYSVFGRVLGTGMTIVDRMAGLPRTNAGGNFAELPVRNYFGGNIDQNHIVIINAIREVSLFPALTGRSHIEFAVQNTAPQAVVASLAGSTLTLGGIAGGTATITVRATDVNGNVAEGAFTVAVSGGRPVILTQPAPQTVAAGSTVVFGVTARDATSYQWFRNGLSLPGATAATLIIPNAVPASIGSYSVEVTGSIGAPVMSDAVSLTVIAATPNAGRLINLAIRTNAGTGAEGLFVGFAVGGAGTTGAKPLLLRGVGPSLAQFGLTGVLADPVMTVVQGGTTIASNDDWAGDAQVLARSTQVGAFALTGPASLDAALAASPITGAYSVQIVGKTNGTGIALAEIYDATTVPTATTPRLVNVSARTQVGTGGDILIAGFVIGGNSARTVLIRAIGPALAAFGVPGVLADPRLQLFSGSTVIRENDNWGGDNQLTTIGASVGAFALADGASRDAMLLVTLEPGSYTAQVSGVNGGTGVALVEVYEVP
ncbi:MAG: peptidylprolyl isomerase [Opitutaceae bacterium]|nr:peptidylprolyl isomerase [Opitutaceae bacterium]